MMFLPLATEISGFSDALKISGLGFSIVLIVLAVLAVFVKLLSSILSKNKKAENKTKTQESSAVVKEKATEPTPEQPQPEIVSTPGYVILDGVSEQDAAVIMAITSHKTGIDLNRLQFNSIKRLNQNPVIENVSEQDAAVIMAITCNKLNLQPENLIFNSIKLVED